MATKSKTDVYQIVTDQILASLEAGTVPWHKPWKCFSPMSLSTRRGYRGMNRLLLGTMPGEGGNWWGTYKQISALGGQVRKGEKSRVATFWKKIEKQDGDDFMLLKYFNVFNATQADWPDGLPEWAVAPPENTQDPIAAAEAIHHGYLSRPAVIHGGDRACYSPSQDRISLPELSAFDSAAAYHATRFHEEVHSTGHEKRLAREGITDISMFGSHQYGREELIAEVGSAMLCAVAGIECQHEASAAYLASWIKTIKGNPKMVIQAASKAEAACDLILGITRERDEK